MVTTSPTAHYAHRAGSASTDRASTDDYGSIVFIDDLRTVVGVDNVLVPDDAHDELSGYTTDWTGRFVGRTDVVVRPVSKDEVVSVLDVCRRHGRAIVPQGGNTGLVGGSVPMNGEVVLNMRRMNRIRELDPLARHIDVEAGVTVEAVQSAARAAGLRYPVDFAARGTATIGGTIATNAGGVNVLRYGSTRNQVIGLEAVLADGSVVSTMAGLVKDNTGYDLRGLLCGSEGTLGIVTAAILRLVPAFDHVTTALVGCSDLNHAMRIVGSILTLTEGVDAVEIMSRRGVEAVESAFGVVPPFRTPWFVLVEMSANEDRASLLQRVLVECDVTDSALAAGSVQREQLWRIREEHTAAISRLGAPLKYDVTIPLKHLPAFVVAVEDAVRHLEPNVEVIIFGHAADGNLHVNVVGADVADHHRFDAAVLGEVAKVDGSISAEHGVGLAKREWLHLTRSADEIRTMKTIKGALDPRGILNPHVLFAS